MVAELRLKSGVPGVVLRHSRAAGGAGGTETRLDPRLSTTFAERPGRESPGELDSCTGVSAQNCKEATA